MSESCSKCNVVFMQNEVVAKCVECKSSFHSKCTRAGSSQNLTKSKLKSWKCDGCEDEVISTASGRSVQEDPTEDRKFLLEALQSMKNDINKNTDDKIQAVLTSVKRISEDIEKLQLNVSALEVAHSSLDARCGKLEQDGEERDAELHELRRKLNDSEQHQRAANIEIVGLPATENENIYACLEQVAVALGVPYMRNDLSIAHRLRTFSTRRHSHPPIIVQFVSRSSKEVWLKAVKSKKYLKATEVNPALKMSNVYINEHLTAHNKQLLGRARRLQREKKLHFAGYFNGKILVKKLPTDAAVQVCEMRHLDAFDVRK